MSDTVSFVQIVTAVTHQGALLYGLTTNGTVYEYNFSREVWVPLPMRALAEDSQGVNVIGLRGPAAEVSSRGVSSGGRPAPRPWPGG